MNAEHDKKVSEIAAAVREHVAEKRPVQIQKGGVSHFVPVPGDMRRKSMPIDISGLSNILEIDVKNQRCIAEPGVTFAQLAKATLEKGLIPMVVPELEGITVGGAVAGCSVESMSYRYGGFHDSCEEYEIITGEGKVLTCSPRQEPLLFEMVHGSYGTLGILTRLTFKLVPAKQFVKMEYRKFNNFPAYQAEMLRLCKTTEFDFIDGIVHSRDNFVLCLGNFVDKAPYVSNYRWLNIFYKSTAEKSEDYLTTFDYCFRYDTECHWITKSVPLLEQKPVRFAVGKFVLGSTNLIKWSKRLDSLLKLKKRPDVVCDIFIPARRFNDFWKWYEKDFDFFPLWVIPYRIPKMYGWVSKTHGARMQGDLMIDCAVYGKPNGHASVDYSKMLEDKTYELDGVKTLISRNHYTKERFWEIYNRENYDQAKLRLDPKAVFPGLFEKFHRV
ncbi:MAG: FAD-binding oxidoreductase [Deltaproteobacteria bacterium]|nr:FAD-binding oxidoreductase [Deltaproteobacteria bacterium]